MIIEVLANGKTTKLEGRPGDNLARVLTEARLMEGAECNRGVCGKCAVKLLAGVVAPLRKGNKNAIREDGCILACQSELTDQDIRISAPERKDNSSRKTRLPSLGREHALNNPLSRKVFLKLAPPALNDQQSDLERILDALAAKEFAGKRNKSPGFRPSLLPGLPELLRKSGFEITCVFIDDELVAVEPGNTVKNNYGFIVDIGTTTVAIYLVDLASGETMDAEGIANPQRVFGADVVSRISAASTPEALKQIQELIVKGISETFESILRRNELSRANIYNIVIVGNTAMSHLFLGVDPQNLAIAPFIPCFRSRTGLIARDLNLPAHPEARVNLLANISGYVGSDTLGVAMATRMNELPGCSLAVDIGTNGEILLGYGGRIYACSAAAGPAFEGAHITHGMRAGDGAIEKASLADGNVNLRIIGDKPPVGICGSGLIDCVAELLRARILEPSGCFTGDDPILVTPLGQRLREGADGIREFALAWKGEFGNDHDIVITQKDIRELQLAKAAIAAGIAVLLLEAGAEADKVDHLFLAGAFGHYLDRENAAALGLFPGIPVEKIIPVGNAAAEGAGICLMSRNALHASDALAASIRPVELSGRADFNDLLLNYLNFPAQA